MRPGPWISTCGNSTAASQESFSERRSCTTARRPPAPGSPARRLTSLTAACCMAASLTARCARPSPASSPPIEPSPTEGGVMKRRLCLMLIVMLVATFTAAARERNPERMVRAVYTKFTALNQAAEENQNGTIDHSLALKFELRNFHSGPIADVLGIPYGQLVTLPN